MTRINLAYRKTAAQGASGFGLLTALFDTLAGNIQRAAEAERANDLEKRSSEVKHALLVIGCLEDWVRRGPGGELADKLVIFYASLRRELVRAEITRSAESFEKEMARVLEIRSLWQQVDLRQSSSEPEVLDPNPINGLALASMQADTRYSNWSA